MSGHAHDIKKEVRGYFIVFGALLFFTIVTVLASYFKVNIMWAITIALIIATIKASLVVCFFMHLISEKQLVYLVLIFVVIFFMGLLFLPWIEGWNIPEGAKYVP